MPAAAPDDGARGATMPEAELPCAAPTSAEQEAMDRVCARDLALRFEREDARRQNAAGEEEEEVPPRAAAAPLLAFAVGSAISDEDVESRKRRAKKARTTTSSVQRAAQVAVTAFALQAFVHHADPLQTGAFAVPPAAALAAPVAHAPSSPAASRASSPSTTCDTVVAPCDYYVSANGESERRPSPRPRARLAPILPRAGCSHTARARA